MLVQDLNLHYSIVCNNIELKQLIVRCKMSIFAGFESNYFIIKC